MSDNSSSNLGSSQDSDLNYDEELANPPPISEVSVANPDELKAEANGRSKQRQLLQKILSVFQKEKESYRELIINSEPLEKRVALLVDGRLEKF